MTAASRLAPHRLLITGVTRTLGRQLAEELYYDDRVALILGTALDERLPYYFRNYDPGRFLYRTLDLNRRRSVDDFFHSRAFREAEIDTVVHLAFKSDPRRYDEPAHRLNVDSTERFLSSCLDCPSVRQFVYMSSASVYRLGPRMDVLVSEDAELNLDADAHPLLKDAVGAELLCRTRLDHPRCSVVVLRPSGVVGRNVRSELNLLLESTVCFRALGYDPMINPIHARDVVRALKEVVMRELRGVFNLAGPDVAPLSTFLFLSRTTALTAPAAALTPLYAAARRLGLTRYDHQVNPRRLLYPLVLDASLAQAELGFEPRHHIKFG